VYSRRFQRSADRRRRQRSEETPAEKTEDDGRTTVAAAHPPDAVGENGRRRAETPTGESLEELT